MPTKSSVHHLQLFTHCTDGLNSTLISSQLAVVEQALETAGLMLGTSKSRGYSLEMICADFLAGADADGANREVLMFSLRQIYRSTDLQLLPLEQQNQFRYEIKGPLCRA